MTKSNNIAIYTIYSEGKKISDTYYMSHASIRLEANRIGKATLKFQAATAEEPPFEGGNRDFFKQGNALKIEIEQDKKSIVLFEGVIVATEIQIAVGQSDLLTVECRDYAYLTTMGRKNTIYEEQKDSDIFKKIITGYADLSLKSDATTIKHASLVQYYCSDWDFLLSRADSCGMIILICGKEISIVKPNVSAQPVTEYTYGVNIIDFKGKLSLSEQYQEVSAIAWNHSKQELTESKSKKQSVNAQGDLKVNELTKLNKNTLLYQTDAPIEKESLQSWADATSLKNLLSRYSGHFMVYGNTALAPGSLVGLKGFGKRFDGNAFVGGIEHIIEDQSWFTKVEMGLSHYRVVEEPDITAPLASGFLPGVQGLHIGVVKQLDKDPMEEYRILIELPLMNGDKKTLWARLITPYSGKEAGILFVPEVGEEVVVGFFNNDPCHPVILGSMFNKKNTPPTAFSQKNELKTIVTKEKLTLEFDDGKKTITIRTPGENMIEISDEKKLISIDDQNKNRIVMSDKGISFETNKDLIFSAKGNIQLEAASKVNITSKSSDVITEGLNIKSNAKVGITCKGNATAEFSSSGNTTIKGGMVMIN